MNGEGATKIGGDGEEKTVLAFFTYGKGGDKREVCRFHSRRMFEFAEFCSLRCFATVITSCVHELRSGESLTKKG